MSGNSGFWLMWTHNKIHSKNMTFQSCADVFLLHIYSISINQTTSAHQLGSQRLKTLSHICSCVCGLWQFPAVGTNRSHHHVGAEAPWYLDSILEISYWNLSPCSSRSSPKLEVEVEKKWWCKWRKLILSNILQLIRSAFAMFSNNWSWLGAWWLTRKHYNTYTNESQAVSKEISFKQNTGSPMSSPFWDSMKIPALSFISLDWTKFSFHLLKASEYWSCCIHKTLMLLWYAGNGFNFCITQNPDSLEKFWYQI